MTVSNKILVVDDEESILWVFKKALEKRNITVHTAESAQQALDKIQRNDYLLIFTDIFMEGMSGLDLLTAIKSRKPSPPVVVMTAQDTMNNTIEAMRQGAFDYVSKPFDLEDIYDLVDRVVETSNIKPPEKEPTPPEEAFSVDAIIGRSKHMQDIFKTIGKASVTDLAVLITGESGTGKEMVARALHYYSHRVEEKFIAINCAAIARELLESELFGHEKGAFTGAVESKKGKFELANRGTLFLDEIGDMEISLQAKILRVLQNNEFYRVGGREPVKVDVRIIAATNQNLHELMKQKLFREDLFHRLNVIQIPLPPLRERLEDVPHLANFFLRRISEELAHESVFLSPEVDRLFKNYQWPGNIRELENVIKRGAVLASGGAILPEHLPPGLQEGVIGKSAVNEFWEQHLDPLVRGFLQSHAESDHGNLYDKLVDALEKNLFEHLLRRLNGNQVATAKALGINRNTLKRKIDALNIEPKKGRHLNQKEGTPEDGIK
ncbi:MAG: nitrogen regulation protein NR(I) [Candidatus Nitronauta litoralis]|uniref:DNA-binding transcriptional regulator NtrC n=1 Tax=Candidatus Nitronauta litoralis TaxID=2705533 RepID=A0A7T0G0E2_9BACT|nr:MAG: nitrogen regulation protein NR(I) [Candidatus Nitronauta litoralis]